MRSSLLIKFSVRGGSCKWYTIDPYDLPRPTFGRGGRNLPLTAERVAKKRKRRITSLARLFASLATPPMWFMHLNFDRRVKRDWTLDECRDLFKRFIRFLTKRYRRSWFIWVMELSDKTGLHYHLTGRFGEKKAEWSLVRNEWLKLTGSVNEDMFGHKEFDSRHPSYLMSGKKAKKTCALLWELGNKSFYGVINRKNMHFHPEQQAVLSWKEWGETSAFMNKKIASTGGPTSSLDRLKNMSGSLNFCRPKMLARAFDVATGKKGTR